MEIMMTSSSWRFCAMHDVPMMKCGWKLDEAVLCSTGRGPVHILSLRIKSLDRKAAA